MGKEPERLRAREIGFQVSRWMSDPSIPDDALPASPDDVLWLLAEVERLARTTAHVGEPATVERIKAAHSALALRWLGDVPGNPHGAYKQAHGEECFICTLLRSIEAAEAECERLAGRVAALTAALESISRLDQSSDEGYRRLYRQAQSTAVSALTDVGGSE